MPLESCQSKRKTQSSQDDLNCSVCTHNQMHARTHTHNACVCAHVCTVLTHMPIVTPFSTFGGFVFLICKDEDHACWIDFVYKGFIGFTFKPTKTTRKRSLLFNNLCTCSSCLTSLCLWSTGSFFSLCFVCLSLVLSSYLCWPGVRFHMGDPYVTLLQQCLCYNEISYVRMCVYNYQ